MLRFLFALVLLALPASAGEIVQHVYLSQAVTEAYVAPAPAGTVAVEIRNMRMGYRARTRLENYHPTIGVEAQTYIGTVDAALQHAATPGGYPWQFYAFGMGTDPGLPTLSAFDGVADGGGTSGHTFNTGFSHSWPFVIDGMSPWFWSSADGPNGTHRLRMLHEYHQIPGAPWPSHYMDDVVYRVHAEFDLVYIVP